ncbi:hypothetical protein [Methanopyrus sp.]
MFFVTAPAVAMKQPEVPKPESDPYEQWKEELRAMFPNYFPHYYASTPGSVKLTGTEVLCACEVTTGKRVELQPGVEATGVLVVTKTGSGADVWFVNWNGWHYKLTTLPDGTITGAAYAPSDDGGIVLLAGLGDGGIHLHALRLSFTTYLNLPDGKTLRVPEIEAERHEVVRIPAKMERRVPVRVLHVGYEYSDGKEKPLFLLLYTVRVADKTVEEYGTDLYVALVRVDPDNLSPEVVYGPVIDDFQHVTVFDANVVETPEKYREYQVGNRKVIVANWVAVAYAKQWKGCGVYLTLLGYSPADDAYLPMASIELSDGDCSPSVGNLRLAHVALDDGTVVFLTIWTDGRDPISHLRDMLTPSLVTPPEGEASVNGEVVWGQPAVLEVGTNPRILASVKNKPVAIIPEVKQVSLIGIKGSEGSALFWLDVVGNDGIRSFPIPVVVKREGTAVYATPSVFAVTLRTEKNNKLYDVLMWVFGTSDPRAGEPGLIPNVVLPEDEFRDTKIWEPWASTLTFDEKGLNSTVTVTIGKTLELPEIPAGDKYVTGKMLGTVYQTQQGVFVVPSVPIVCLRSPVLIRGYQPVVPLRYRMLKPTVIVSGPEEPVIQGSVVAYRITLSVDGNALTLRPGLSTVIIVKRLNEIVGAALVKLEPNGPIVRYERGLKRVEVELEGLKVRSIDAWVSVEDSGRYTFEVFFADSLGRLMEGEAVAWFTVRRQPPSQAPLPAYREYLPPRLGIVTAPPRGSGSRPGVVFPVPVPARVRTRGAKGKRMTG